MSYLHETRHLRLAPEQDRRRKLSDAQKEDIRRLYAAGVGSMQALADRYLVSKTTVLRIVNPKSAQRVKDHTKAHWREYHDREKLTRAVRETRRYKQRLFLAGQLPGQQEGGETT